MYIRTSKIAFAGFGAFTSIDLKRGVVIGRYVGRLMTKQEVDEMYGDNVATYVLKVYCDSVCDCMFPPHIDPHVVYVDGAFGGNWSAYMNDGPHSGIAANVEFQSDGSVMTVRDIKANEELLVDYGSEYWNINSIGSS